MPSTLTSHLKNRRNRNRVAPLPSSDIYAAHQYLTLYSD